VTWPVRAGAIPPLADGFVSRPETAPDLRTALTAGGVVALAPDKAAAGRVRGWLGSCGKTQLALSAAELMFHAGGLDLLVWVAATSRASILAGYVEAATTAMGITASGNADSVATRFVRWLGDTNRSWLVVFDDLSQLSHLDGLWPEGPTGRVLITTPDPAILAGVRQPLVFPVGTFSSREALNYLMGRLSADPDQRLGAIDLVEDLGCEPMALAQASAVIASSSQTCRDYRGRLERRSGQLAETLGDEQSAAALTWTLSVDQAERLAPGNGVELLLAFAALLDGHEIPGAVFTTQAVCGYLAQDAAPELSDPRRVWDGVLGLERTGLMEIDRGGRTHAVRMNHVVQSAVRAAMPERMVDRVAKVAADALLEAWPAEEPNAWLTASLRACVISLQRTTGNALWAGRCHPVLMRAGTSLDQVHLNTAAVAYWQDLTSVSDRLLGAAHEDTLTAGQHLAEAYLAAGRVGEAVSAFQWVLSSQARALGPEHPSIIAGQINVGRALVAAGEPAEALSVLADALSVCERVRGPAHPETLSAREELAAAYSSAGRLDDAIKLYQRTLEEREHAQGGRHPDTITTRQRLGDVYLADGQGKQALAQHKKALADRERTVGPDHPDTMVARTSLGTAYYSIGRMASALQLFEQARSDSERLLGTDHPATLARRANLANAYYAVGRLTDAKTLLTDTEARCDRVLPAGDPLIQAVRESLANISEH
jgi:tetratricopeptide (TPR) repeat protein